MVNKRSGTDHRIDAMLNVTFNERRVWVIDLRKKWHSLEQIWRQAVKLREQSLRHSVCGCNLLKTSRIKPAQVVIAKFDLINSSTSATPSYAKQDGCPANGSRRKYDYSYLNKSLLTVETRWHGCSRQVDVFHRCLSTKTVNRCHREQIFTV